MCNDKSLHDPVNHPPHYLKAAIIIEPIELTARLNACLGQAVNYIVRAPYKGSWIEDLQKAIFYLKKYDELANCPHSRRGVALPHWLLAQLFAKNSRDTFTRDILGALFVNADLSSKTIAATIRIIEDVIERVRTATSGGRE